MIPVIWPINNGYNFATFLSSGAVYLNRIALRYSLPIFLLALSGGVSAVGLGELRGHPALGERIQLEIDLLGVEKQKLDASCFRLVQPSGGDEFPWLKRAALSIRKGTQPVLVIASNVPMREPIMQVAVQLGCGHEISRDYTILASPENGNAPSSPVRRPVDPDAFVPQPQPAAQRPIKVRPAVPATGEVPPRLTPRKAERPSRAAQIPDRLMLSDGFVGEPSLRLATELLGGDGAVKEEQRDILRLEFRMLMAMHQQATSQLATAEKLRTMEATLGELQQRAAGVAQRVEKEGSVPLPTAGVASAVPQVPAVLPEPRPAAPQAMAPTVVPPVQEDSSSGLSEWSLYGVLIGSVLGLAGWLGWRHYRNSRLDEDESRSPIYIPEVKVDPKRADEREELGGIDLPFEPAAMGMPMQVDLELDSGNESVAASSEMPQREPVQGHDSMMSINATSLDEHFEANPVMELADIMLSFGRVKGAAQALQEYIDNNPQEALQPWIRLMDVYRMAGMRAEFENVARNLNQHFNVEVQSWDDALASHSALSPDGVGSPVAPRAMCLEDLPRLMNTVIGLWETGDVVGYLYQLLRDNRGGQRLGFSLPVVEDILFLIELKETANRMETT